MASEIETTFLKLENTWTKLTRYQHHLRFLERCLFCNIIPQGLVARLDVNLAVHNADLQEFCKTQLLSSSKNILVKLHSSIKLEVSRLLKELHEVRTEAFNCTDYNTALGVWFHIRNKVRILHDELKCREDHKITKGVIFAPQATNGNPVNTDDSSNLSNGRCGTHKRTRRFNKTIRQRRNRRRLHANPSYSEPRNSSTDTPLLDLDPVNLTSEELSEEQISLLRKGPSFCPLPKDINWLKMQDDWDKFERRVRLKAFFHGKQESNKAEDGEKAAFKPPSTSTWNPPKSKHPELELFLSEVKKGIFNPANINKPKDNLSKGERIALKQLKADSNCVIRIQDKGSRFVLLSKDNYVSKMVSQLDNPLHYRELARDPSETHLALVKAWGEKWLRKGEISPEIAEWVSAINAKPGVAYGNVKTHKLNNPLRLITSCCGTAIERLSELTEFYLKPLAQGLPSFIKDTTHLLQKIQEVNNTLGPLPADALLVSWDVVSMFPNIDNTLGLTAVRNTLEARTTQVPSTDCIVEAVEICLQHNNSQFSDKNYLQTHGTAMGPKNACSYADIAMGHIDHLAKTGGSIHPTFWWRYRDDIIDVWMHGLSKLHEFTEYINSLYPTIKFELVVSQHQLNVLDLTMHLNNGFIETDIYSKPTDSHLYLAPSSAHPSHCKKAIPYNVALRLKRNCSSSQFLEKRNAEYKSYLVQQGYNASLVEGQFNQIAALSRNELLKPATRNKNKRKVTPLVIDYNPNLPEVGRIIQDNLHILHSTPLMREIFPDRNIITAFRRPKNLKELVAPSKFRPRNNVNDHQRPTPSGCFKCQNRCDLCSNYFIESSSFTSFATGKTYRIKEHLSCDSKNLIYLVSCNKCKLQYVGSTKTSFKVRFRNHKSTMKNNRRTCEVAVHFNEAPHTFSDFSFTCIEAITCVDHNIDQVLINREAYWTAQLFTLNPFGLNKRQERKSKNRIQYN